MPQPLADNPQHVMYFQSEYNNRIGVICNNIIIYCIVLLQIWHIENLVVFVGVVEFSNSTLMFMSNWKHIWRIIKQTIAAFDNSKRGFKRKYEFWGSPQSSIIQKHFQMEMWPLMNQVCCGHKVISNDDMDFYDSKILMIPKCSNDKR